MPPRLAGWFGLGSEPSERATGPRAVVTKAVGTVITLGLMWLVFQWSTGGNVEQEDRRNGRFVYVTKAAMSAGDFGGGPLAATELSAAELTGACWTFNAFKADHLLDGHIAILNDPGLRRSAELLSGRFARDDVAFEAERIGAKDLDWSLHAVMSELETDARWTQAQLGRARTYLRTRRQAPTNSGEEFVVIRANQTLDQVALVRLAVGRTDFQGVSRKQSLLELGLQRSDGSRVSIDGSSLGARCD